MDDKRIIDLAHECELFDGQHYGSFWADRIRLFAVSVEVEAEQRERDACAAICDRFALRNMHPAECAAAIRARGES